jgi:hypothetical protein
MLKRVSVFLVSHHQAKHILYIQNVCRLMTTCQKMSKRVASLNTRTLGGVECYHKIINLQHSGMSSPKIRRVRHAVRPRTTTLLPLDRISWNFTLETLLKSCQPNSSFIQV